MTNTTEFRLTSPVFEHNDRIPDIYTCAGKNINPALNIQNIPENTKSLVLIMDDPDAPMGTWDHWILFNIPLIDTIEENSVPDNSLQGKNSWGRFDYGGPCPPSGTHRYFFKLYAIDTLLDKDTGMTKSDVESRIDGHIIAKCELIGLYSK